MNKNITETLAKDLRVGQEILGEIYEGDFVPLLISDIEYADAFSYDGEWYRNEYADTLDTYRGAMLRITGITLDGLAHETLLLCESDVVVLIPR